MSNLVVVHIGKCSGSTVIHELNSHHIQHSEIHIRRVVYHPEKKYVIIIRNPIQRFISAFNWRYYLVCDKGIQKKRFPNEKKILNKYQNVNRLCKELQFQPNIFNGNLKSGNYIHHLKEDIFFYLKNFIKKCPKKQIFGVICKETLQEDMKRVFNIRVTRHLKSNNKYQKNITEKNYKILKSYLKNDYDIINQMYKYKWINVQQYSYLNH